MNNQTLFDTIVRHLYTQRKQAKDSKGSCLYRAPGDLKCAVGCAIPDDKYEPEMDTENLTLQSVMQGVGIHSRHYGLLANLQVSHDSDCYWDKQGPNADMVARLKQTAKIFSLNTTVLEEVSA